MGDNAIPEPVRVEKPANEMTNETAPDSSRSTIKESHDATDAPAQSLEDMPKLKVFAIWLSIIFGIMCTFLDEGIISTAIPKITDEFHSLGDIGWYGSAYLLTLCAFQLVFGRLYSQFDVKAIYLASLATFHLGSLLCAVSRSSTMFIVGRAIAGCGGSGLSSGTIALFAGALPPHKLPLYVGALGIVYGIAAVFGPVVGGLITHSHLSWRWCFYINLPLAAPPAIATVFFIKLKTAVTDEKKPEWRQRLLGIDYLGMILLIPGITSLILALEFGGTQYGWGNGRTIGCFVSAGVLFVLFALEQWWMGEKALVPPRIFTMRVVLFASIFTFCLESAFLVLVYYIPLWFQAVQGVSAEQSGVRYLPLCIAFIAAIFSGGWIVTKLGYVQPFMLAGTVLVSIGSGLLSTLQASSGAGKWIPFQIIAGLGIGASTEQPSVAVQSFLAEEDAPIGVALVLFFRNLGPSIFISVANSVFAQTLASDLETLLPNVDTHLIISSGATAMRDLVDEKDLGSLLEAYNKGVTRAFVVAAALAAASVLGLPGMGTRRLQLEPDDATPKDDEESSGTELKA
ncbi:hypothetical protein HIM_11495 [Hirsutella minnesotensis 3608]|uniref:Major facilitator superfamily (MFS) profile domain-containing protein n=1 Tax=Hirsutella minnesotensis 3608 TaxID=1043627 RepID=A0A0F7ZFG8_9HYPO|nr:hypothetical protein HIM_11495 [Hirsutella minnesotensis 3608]